MSSRVSSRASGKAGKEATSAAARPPSTARWRRASLSSDRGRASNTGRTSTENGVSKALLTTMPARNAETKSRTPCPTSPVCCENWDSVRSAKLWERSTSKERWSRVAPATILSDRSDDFVVSNALYTTTSLHNSDARVSRMNPRITGPASDQPVLGRYRDGVRTGSARIASLVVGSLLLPTGIVWRLTVPDASVALRWCFGTRASCQMLVHPVARSAWSEQRWVGRVACSHTKRCTLDGSVARSCTSDRCGFGSESRRPPHLLSVGEER